MSAAALGDRAGCFGKLPQRGDFVRRDLDGAFVDALDGWLQGAMPATRDRLGEDWLALYLTAPVWCYVLGSATAGGCAHAGILAPSADRVGRCYPLTVAAPVGTSGAVTSGAGTSDTAAWLDAWLRWFDAATALVLNVLDDAGDADTFLGRLRDLGVPPPLGDQVGVHLPQSVAMHALHALPLALSGSAGLWWTDGNDVVAPCRVVAPGGLPPGAAFAAFLDGAWSRHGWTDADDGGDVGPAEAAGSGRGRAGSGESA